MLGVVGNVIILFCWKFNKLSSSEKKIKDRLIFNEIIATVGWWRIFETQCTTTKQTTQTAAQPTEAIRTYLFE